MPPWAIVLPSLIAALGSGVSRWAGGKAEERAGKQAEQFELERMAQQRQTQALGLGSEMAFAKYQEGQKRVGQQRSNSHLINGLSSMLMMRPPKWLLPPTAEDVRAEAMGLDPEAFQFKRSKVSGPSGWEIGLGIGGAAGAAGGAAYSNYQLMQALGANPFAGATKKSITGRGFLPIGTTDMVGRGA